MFFFYWRDSSIKSIVEEYSAMEDFKTIMIEQVLMQEPFRSI
jgi:hypothetical protein